MSLILDALNKADRQRDDQEPVPSLTTYHAAPLKPKLDAGIPRWMLYSVLGLLLLVVVGLGLLLVQGSVGRPPAFPVPVVDVKPSLSPLAEPKVQASELQAAINKPLQDQRVGGERIDNAPLVSEPEPAISAEVAAIYGQVGVEGVATPEDDVVDLYGGSISPEKSQREVRAPSVQKPKPAVSPLVDDNELQALWLQSQVEGEAIQQKVIDPYAKLPYLHQLPESFQNRIPTLMYQNHIYSAKASAVILNGKTYRKGDELAPSLLIEAVTEEELVLSYLNKPFKLAALSSWVKMD